MKKKYIIIVLFYIVVIVSNLFPIFLPSEDRYMGINYNVVDTNTYFSFIDQVSENRFLFSNRFTSEEVPYVMFRPEFLVIGLVAILLGDVLTYFLFKFTFALLFVFLVDRLIKLAVGEKYQYISTFFVLFGSGVGYFFLMINRFGFKMINSVDYMFGVSNSIGLNILPVHFIISVCLLISVFILYYNFWNNKKKNLVQIVLAGILTSILALIHIFDVVTLSVVFGSYMLFIWKKRKENLMDIIKYNLVICIFVLPSIIYMLYLFYFNPYISQWNTQNVLPSPPIQTLGLGFLIPLILSAVHFVKSYDKLKEFEKLLYIWMIVGFFLLYFPLNIQVRFLEGLFIPIMILGSLGLIRVIVPFIETKMRVPKTVTIALVFLLISPTSFLWIEKQYSLLKIEDTYDEYVPGYLSNSELEALKWIKDNSETEDIVLSGYKIGNYIPRLSGNRVFFGHWAQTIDFEGKKDIFKGFYSGTIDRREIIDEYKIKYIYYGEDERTLGEELVEDYLVEKYRNEDVVIYEVI